MKYEPEPRNLRTVANETLKIGKIKKNIYKMDIDNFTSIEIFILEG